MDLTLCPAGTDYISKVGDGFTVFLWLTGGSNLDIEDHTFGSGGATDSLEWRGDYGALFDQPIPLEDIQVFMICSTEVPVEIP